MRRKKLFTPLPDGVGREVRIEFRASEAEREKIKHLAAVRQMPLSEFLRKAALGRAAPMDFDTDLVLCLSDATRAIRALHKAYLGIGCQPPEDLLRPVIENTIIAIKRISNSK
jgi:uncharacterized protein (DUF1778 family)